MAEYKRLALIAALSYSSGLGLAQSSGSSESSASASTTTTSSTSSSSRTKVIQTTNYIDTIDGYSSLSSCAIDVLSTVVRGEFSGCGGWDDNLTSYTCFCTDSYSFMSTVISTDIITSCNGGSTASAQATSALSVFDEYCALGVEAGLEPTSECRYPPPTRACRMQDEGCVSETCQLTLPRCEQPARQTPPQHRARQAPRPHRQRRRAPRPPPTRRGPPPSPWASWSPSSC